MSSCDVGTLVLGDDSGSGGGGGGSSSCNVGTITIVTDDPDPTPPPGDPEDNVSIECAGVFGSIEGPEDPIEIAIFAENNNDFPVTLHVRGRIDGITADTPDGSVAEFSVPANSTTTERVEYFLFDDPFSDVEKGSDVPVEILLIDVFA